MVASNGGCRPSRLGHDSVRLEARSYSATPLHSTSQVMQESRKVAVLWEWFFLGSEIGHVGGLGDPGGPAGPSKRWGASPPIFWNGLPGPRGRPDLKHDRFPILKRCYSHPMCSHVQVSLKSGPGPCVLVVFAVCLSFSLGSRPVFLRSRTYVRVCVLVAAFLPTETSFHFIGPNVDDFRLWLGGPLARFPRM